MTEQELQDYHVWFEHRRQAGLATDHETWKNEREAALARQKADNAAMRREYLARLEAQRADEQARYDSEIEASLAEDKTRLQNEWLANNPTLTAEDFERRTWNLLKANLIQERENAQMQVELQAARASMDFG
jgi:hypothetical protein